MGQCIYCRTITQGEPEEHIVPHGLVGDATFSSPRESVRSVSRRLVLSDDEVCGGCNGANGELDHYLQKQLGLVKALVHPSRSRSGRPPVAERPGLRVTRTPSGLQVMVNSSNKPMKAPDGSVIPPPGQHPMAARLTSFHADASHWTATVSHPIRVNKKTVRALHKISFELLCHRKGPRFVLSSRFDAVRDYVRWGTGAREAFLYGQADPLPLRVGFLLGYHKPSGAWFVRCSLGLVFLIDLSQDNRLVLLSSISEVDGVPLVRIGRRR